MFVDKIKIEKFRNLIDQEICFDPSINVFCGKNGMGKTNLLESVYFVSIGRSPRTRKDSECICFNNNRAKINLQYIRADNNRSIDIEITNKQKNIAIDNMTSNRISDIVGNFGSVYFSPDETQIVRGSPTYRRRFMDIINCQVSKEYMRNLSRYQHAILQRNNYLKTRKPTQYSLELECWDNEIAKSCAILIKRRAMFLEKLSVLASEIHKELSGGVESIYIDYATITDEPQKRSLQELADCYINGVKENFQRDSILGYSTFGAHNDDYEIELQYLSQNTDTNKTINLRKSGSLGQQRTATLALKLAEVEILQEEYGEPPVLLLDDVLGELDENRRKKLLEFCKQYQTIITCTEWENQLPAKVFSVDHGEIKE